MAVPSGLNIMKLSIKNLNSNRRKNFKFWWMSRSGESFDWPWKSDVTFCQYHSSWNLTKYLFLYYANFSIFREKRDSALTMWRQYRRTDLCTSFAIKLYRSPRRTEFFVPAIKHVKTRTKNQNFVIEQKCNTKRAYNAPHNYLARLINQNSEKIRKQK